MSASPRHSRLLRSNRVPVPRARRRARALLSRRAIQRRSRGPREPSAPRGRCLACRFRRRSRFASFASKARRTMIACTARLEVLAVPGVPLVGPGADVPAIVSHALASSGIVLVDGDVLVVTSKLLSRAEGRFVELPRVQLSARAIEIAKRVDKDARLVELI